MHLSSVRQTLFDSDEARLQYLRALMHGSYTILTTGLGLSDAANYHEVCRLLARYVGRPPCTNPAPRA